MSEDSIMFDFANGQIITQNNGETGILAMPELAEKRAAIYIAAGLEQISGEEIISDIQALLQILKTTEG